MAKYIWYQFGTNKSCRDMLPEQGTEDQMILGPLVTSHDKPKVGILCTVFDRVVNLSYLGQQWPKQYI